MGGGAVKSQDRHVRPRMLETRKTKPGQKRQRLTGSKRQGLPLLRSSAEQRGGDKHTTALTRGFRADQELLMGYS